MTHGKRVAFHTLGCKVNQGESDALAGLFAAKGYLIVPGTEPADIVVINTCTVTQISDRKSRQVIRRFHRQNPNAILVVTGCYAQTAPDEVLGLAGVNLVVGTNDRTRIVELVEEWANGQGRPAASVNLVADIGQARSFEELPAVSEVSRARANLKVQEGCNLFCTYCIIPYARGPVRSRPIASVLEEARHLVDKGFKEIVITGIHTGAYGADLGLELADLIENLLSVSGLERLRISSVEPQEFTPRLLDLIHHPKICRHFHVPLQSGSDKILKKMARRYTVAEYLQVLASLRERIPAVAVTTDVIVGFPGEEEEDFQATVNTCSKAKLAGIHVFPYSPRKGTPAASYTQQVPAKIKEERVQTLSQLGKQWGQAYAHSFLGSSLVLLVEEVGQKLCLGHTDNYLKVAVAKAQLESYLNSRGEILEDDEGLRGQLVTVQITGWQEQILTAQITSGR